MYDRANSNISPLRKSGAVSGHSNRRPLESLGDASRRWRASKWYKEPPACEKCQTTGILGYTLEQGTIYCDCPNAQRAIADEQRIQAEIRAEQRTYYMERNQQRLLAFSKKHRIHQGAIPTLGELGTPFAQKLQRFADNFGGADLIMTGPNGVGKTQLALSLGQTLLPALAERRMSLRVITAPDLFEELRNGMESGSKKFQDSYADIFEGYQTCGLLILDDLGAERATDWVLEHFNQLFDERYRQSLRTVITSNLPTELPPGDERAREALLHSHQPIPAHLETLADRVDKRVMDRIGDTFVGLVIDGPNYRMQGGR